MDFKLYLVIDGQATEDDMTKLEGLKEIIQAEGYEVADFIGGRPKRH